MSLRLAALSIALGAAACADTVTALELAPATQAVVLEELGLSLEVPPGWTVETSGHASVIAGPIDTDAYYTPIVVQVIPAETEAPPPEVGPPAPAPQLTDLLARAYGRAAAISEVRWAEPSFAVIADRLALTYDVRFELFEKQRRRAGALVDVAPYVVDVSYAGVEELFMEHLPVFVEALASISVEP